MITVERVHKSIYACMFVCASATNDVTMKLADNNTKAYAAG